MAGSGRARSMSTVLSILILAIMSNLVCEGYHVDPLREICACDGGPVTCTMKDIVTTTTPALPNDRDGGTYYHLQVLNGCERCSARYVMVESDDPGYPTLINGGERLMPWETYDYPGRIPGRNVDIYRPATQVDFQCV